MWSGVMYFLAWYIRLSKYIAMVSVPVMIGFCNALALIIAVAQLQNVPELSFAHAFYDTDTDAKHDYVEPGLSR